AMLAPPPLPNALDDEDAAESRTNEGNFDLGPRTTIAPVPPRPQVAAPMAAPPPPPAPVRSSPVVASAPAPITVAEIIKPRTKPAQFEEKPYPWRDKTAVVAAVAPSP